ncbi:MAG: hypothetical protein WD081_04885 [Gammaproteobacteria bacterium]
MNGIAAWVVLALATAASTSASLPERPQVRVDLAPPAVSGRTLFVGHGDDIAAALRRAERGDEIVLQPGVVYRGPFVLPKKSGSGWITIRSAASDSLAAGRRVGPEDRNSMPVLEAGSGHLAVVSVEPGASHYRLIGLEIRPAAGEFLHNLVSIGRGDEAEPDVPHHIVIDRCFVHGDARVGARRGIALNARHAAVTGSYISDIKEVGQDSQAVAGWNGPGPLAVINNYLEAAGENLMFGGGIAAIDGLVPSDIEIRGNHLSKPLSWRIEDPTYAGTPWAVKNILELKNARRVLIEGNTLEHSWTHAQTGFAVLFTVRNEGGRMPWATVQDVTFTNNLVRRAGNGINILGTDTNGRGDQRTRRILIENNQFLEIGGDWGGGRLFQLIDATESIAIRGNSAEQTGSIVVTGGREHRGFVFTDNAAPHNDYGIVGSGTAPGASTLSHYFPGAEFARNTISGGSARLYPAGNTFPPDHRVAARGVDRAELCTALATSNPLPDGLAMFCAMSADS